MHLYVCKMFCVLSRFKVAENREKHGQGNGQQRIREVSQRRREQANGVLRIPCSSEYGIGSGILYFPLNYTSSEIHFEQFEILTSFLAWRSIFDKINKKGKSYDSNQTVLICQSVPVI